VNLDIERIDIVELRKYNPTLARIILQKRVAKYMEYPPNNKPTPFVIQKHEVGKSQHYDVRFKVNGYLVGWTIVGFSTKKPASIERLKKYQERGYRAETKARQPLQWLKAEGIIEPGEVGAGVDVPGKLTIIAGTKKNKAAKAILGAQKVWFHEYFLRDGINFKDWTRIIYRAIKVPKLDPETKKPIKGETEIIWRFLTTKDQTPYAISSRAIREKWKPPKGIIPFPVEWAKKNFSKRYEKWEEYMGKAKKSLASAKYALVEHSYMGPVHIRAVPKKEYHLLIQDKERPIDFRSVDSPIYEPSVAMTLEGRIASKWLEYEGELKPKEHWNPNKRIVSNVNILSKGKVDLETETEEGRTTYVLVFDKGALKGRKGLKQEEKGSPFYKFGTLSKLAREGFFVLDEHIIEGRRHFDIRIKKPEEAFAREFSGMRDNIAEKGIDRPIKAVWKRCLDLTWLDPKFREGERRVGKTITKVRRLDQGEVQLLEDTPIFLSFVFKGRTLKGYIIAKKEDSVWSVSKSELPKTEEHLNKSYITTERNKELESLQMEEIRERIDIMKHQKEIIRELLRKDDSNT